MPGLIESLVREWRALVYVIGLIVALAVSVALVDDCNEEQDRAIEDHEARLRSVEALAPAIEGIEGDVDEIKDDIDRLTEHLLEGGGR